MTYLFQEILSQKDYSSKFWFKIQIACDAFTSKNWEQGVARQWVLRCIPLLSFEYRRDRNKLRIFVGLCPNVRRLKPGVPITSVVHLNSCLWRRHRLFFWTEIFDTSNAPITGCCGICCLEFFLSGCLLVSFVFHACCLFASNFWSQCREGGRRPIAVNEFRRQDVVYRRGAVQRWFDGCRRRRSSQRVTDYWPGNLITCLFVQWLTFSLFLANLHETSASLMSSACYQRQYVVFFLSPVAVFESFLNGATLGSSRTFHQKNFNIYEKEGSLGKRGGVRDSSMFRNEKKN